LVKVGSISYKLSTKSLKIDMCLCDFTAWCFFACWCFR